MGVTTIKRIENRSAATAAVFDLENPNARGHGVAVPPGGRLAVDLPIPWAPNGWDVPANHLEIRLGGQPRFAVWQAAKGDGDFVRCATDRAWHDPGDRIFGLPAVDGDRLLVVLDRYLSLLPFAPPAPLPDVTTIARVENRTARVATLFDAENPNAPGHGQAIGPDGVAAVHLPIPWAGRADEFPGHHLELRLDGQPRAWLWQAAGGDGNLVRVSTDGRWHDEGEPVQGLSGVNGRRTLVVLEDGVLVVAEDPFGLSVPDLQDLLGMANHRLCDQQPPDPPSATMESVPKRTAVAFSVAGPPSDALDRRQPGARFRYRDSGKRYGFRIDDRGLVVATDPDGRTTGLDRARSFAHRRTGEAIPAPPFDLLAASGGRVFAKAKDEDRFFFATLDETFVHLGPDGNDAAVPSTYFKLDPEFNRPGADPADLTAHLRGRFGHHPAAERFPNLFWPLLERGVMDGMIVRLDRGVWHQVDARPPLSRLNLSLVVVELGRRALAAHPLYALNPLLGVTSALVEALLARLGEGDDRKAPPSGVPVFDHVAFCRTDVLGANPITLRSVRYRRVLDLGIGHVHWHEQYHRVTGGEFQPMRSGRLLNAPLPPTTWLDLYQFANGPIRDGDGYIDGTCNYYVLVQLKDDAEIDADNDGRSDGIHPGAFAILYADEQFYFTQRWRLVDPADHAGLMTALVKWLHDDRSPDLVFSRPLYGWNPATYWCPFAAGQVGRKSRLAAAAQVLLVTGGEPPDRDPALLYSINFSYSTMDRTWRWRALPAPARYFATDEDAWEETIGTDQAPRVYPQTVRLREDTTIHLKGTRPGSPGPGRWYQRYLPAGNALVPPAGDLVAGQRPRTGYAHPWKFLPEAVFARADRFSHLGVFDAVDSRSLFYPVEPATAADAQALAAGEGGAWLDAGGQLAVSAWRFPWSGGGLDLVQKRPPSQYEPVTRLRIARRGGRWIATLWDKRDDDLRPFDGLPQRVMLTDNAAAATLTLGPAVLVDEPPAVRRAHVWLDDGGAAGIAFTAPLVGPGRAFENVWRVRLAALEPDPADPTKIGRVVHLATIETEGRFTPNAAGLFEHRWAPTAAALADLRRCCSAAGEAEFGTSLWFEDVVGHVGVPDELRWTPPPALRVSATPTAIPLGVPVAVTVRATDAQTAAPVEGTVSIDDRIAGTTNSPFTFTFESRIEEEFDPETRVRLRRTVYPAVSVSAPEYPRTGVPLDYYRPSLVARVEPASIPTGRAVQVTVRTTDARTSAPVAGRVAIGGQDIGATNAPFPHTFVTALASGTVTAAGYPTRTVAFPVYAPRLRVAAETPYLWIGRPTTLTIRAADATTGAAAGGRVLLDGRDVAATNVPFVHTFGATPPAGVVRAAGYPDAAIAWPPTRTPTVAATIQPHPVPVGTATTFTVRAVDADSRSPVDGSVTVNGTAVARTNVPFAYTVRVLRRRVYDAETGVFVYELVPPVATVSVAGYATVPLDLGL